MTIHIKDLSKKEKKKWLAESAAEERRDKRRLAAGWKLAPADDSHGFMERPHAPLVWTPPPRKPRQKKAPTKPAPPASDTQLRMDFSEEPPAKKTKKATSAGGK